MDKIAFIDIQGFKDVYNRFILKEVCVHTVDEKINYHAIIGSPFPFNKLIKCEKRQIQWLTRKYHGIHWNDGSISITQFKNDMKAVLKEKIIICKGVEKVKWLQIFLNNISINQYINCEDLDCNFNLCKNFEICEHFDVCDYHKNMNNANFVCAVKNVMKIRRWYFECYTNT